MPAPEGFRAGRDFAAWLGLTPLQKSTGGKQKLGAVSKRGERTIRRLLIIGASAVVQQASRRGAPKGSWLAQMLARKPKMLVTVALANKMARIIWALLVKGGIYQSSGRGGVGRPRSRGREGERKESMAQQSARRGRDNQGFPQCFEHASGDLDPVRELPYRPAAVFLPHQRPDRWQHPTTRHNDPNVFPCPKGGVHRWCMNENRGKAFLRISRTRRSHCAVTETGGMPGGSGRL